MTDEEIKQLLPWYINDTLSADEREAVRALLERSADAREEETFLRGLAQKVQTETAPPVSELGWHRLKRDIRNEHNKAAANDTTTQRWWKPGIAAAAIVVMTLQTGILLQSETETTNITLLGNSQSAIAGEHWLVQVEFKGDSQWHALAALIGEVDGRVVDGPSSIGIVRIAIPEAGSQFNSTAALLDWLEQQPLIEHVAIEQD